MLRRLLPCYLRLHILPNSPPPKKNVPKVPKKVTCFEGAEGEGEAKKKKQLTDLTGLGEATNTHTHTHTQAQAPEGQPGR